MPATGIAIGAAVGASTAATIAASNARNAECRFYIDDYSNIQYPTIAEQREYADCVYRIHGSGKQITGNEILVLKVLIILLVIAFIVGAIKGFNNGDLLDTFMTGLMYAIFTLFFLCFLALLFVGIGFLFT